MCRFDFVVLPVRMWRLNADARMILPVPVFLKRLAAPRWLLILGIALSLVSGPLSFFSLSLGWLLFFRRRRCLSGRFLRLRLGLRRILATRTLAQDHVHLVSFLARHRLGNRQITEIGNQSLQDAAPDFRMRHLTAAEEDRRLHLVAVGEEALDMLLLEVVVV